MFARIPTLPAVVETMIPCACGARLYVGEVDRANGVYAFRCRACQETYIQLKAWQVWAIKSLLRRGQMITVDTYRREEMRQHDTWMNG